MVCHGCSFETTCSKKWEKHLQSKPHLNRSCKCGLTFATESNRLRHIQTCQAASPLETPEVKALIANYEKEKLEMEKTHKALRSTYLQAYMKMSKRISQYVFDHAMPKFEDKEREELHMAVEREREIVKRQLALQQEEFTHQMNEMKRQMKKERAEMKLQIERANATMYFYENRACTADAYILHITKELTEEFESTIQRLMQQSEMA